MLKQTIISLAGAVAIGVGFAEFSSAQAAGLIRGPSHTIDFDKDANGNALPIGEKIDGDAWSRWGVTLSVEAHRPDRSQDDPHQLWLFDSSCALGLDAKICELDQDLRTGQGLPKAGSPRPNSFDEKSRDEFNVAIIQEFGRPDNDGRPDDDAKGGTFTFDFTDYINDKIAGILPESIRFIDIDDNPNRQKVTITLTTEDGTTTKSLDEIVDNNALDEIVMFRGYKNVRNGQLVGEGELGENSVVEYDLSSAFSDLFDSNGDPTKAVKSVDIAFKGSGAIAKFAWSQLHRVHVDEPASIPEPASILGLASLATLAGVQAGRKKAHKA